jgi:uncharacterized protein DUF4199
MDSFDLNARKSAAKSGLLLGLLLLIVSIASYYLIVSATANTMMIILSPIIFSILIPVVLVLIFCLNLRKRIGGYWTFRQAVSAIFVMFLVSYAVQVLGRDVVFAKLIEPDMVNKTQVAMLKATNVMWQKSGASQATINQKRADVQKQFEDQKNITVFGIIQSYIISLMFLFVFAVVFAALFRRNPPEYLIAADTDQ